MQENLLFLFLSGIIFGSGPCLSFCAPILASFIAVYKTSFTKAAVSYLVFSAYRLTSYVIIGAICGLFSELINSDIFIRYLGIFNIILGIFILFIGITTLIRVPRIINKCCSFLHRGNFRNVGLLGLLVGFSPCLPFLGILNYIILISRSVLQSILFSFVFGLGTVVSPLLLVAAFSGKLSGDLSGQERFTKFIRFACASALIFLGLRIILQKLLH
jgi:sulfite exporter TauE/SafE